MDEEEMEDTQRLVEITYDEESRSIITLSLPSVLLLVSRETRAKFLPYYDTIPNINGAANIYVQYEKDLVWVREDFRGIRTTRGSLIEDIFGIWPEGTGLESFAIDYHVLLSIMLTDDIEAGLRHETLEALLKVTQSFSQINIIVDKKRTRYHRWNAIEFSYLGQWVEECAFWVETMWEENKTPYPLNLSLNYETWKVPGTLLDAIGYILGIGGHHPDIEVHLYARDGKKSTCSCGYCGPQKYASIARGEEEDEPDLVAEGREMEDLGVCQRLRLPNVKDSYGGVSKEVYDDYKGAKAVKPRFEKDPDTEVISSF